jgi:hypothetical protein
MIKLIRDVTAYLILHHPLVVDGIIPCPVWVLSVDFPLKTRFGIGENTNRDDIVLTLEETKPLDGCSNGIDGLGFD